MPEIAKQNLNKNFHTSSNPVVMNLFKVERRIYCNASIMKKCNYSVREKKCYMHRYQSPSKI